MQQNIHRNLHYDVIHGYTNIMLAMTMNLIDANIPDPKLWLAEGEIVANNGLKIGCRELTTLHEIKIPTIYEIHYIKFALLCAIELGVNKNFILWANNWIHGLDRSINGIAALKEKLHRKDNLSYEYFQTVGFHELITMYVSGARLDAIAFKVALIVDEIVYVQQNSGCERLDFAKLMEKTFEID